MQGVVDLLLRDSAFAVHGSPLALFVLLLARVLRLAWLVPAAVMLRASWTATAFIGLGLAAVLAPLALASHASGAMPALDATALPALLAELLRGTLLAFAVVLPVHAASWTGHLADRM